MNKIVRVGVLIVMIVLGFTVVFPEWFDFKDQLVAEHVHERAEAEREQQNAATRQRYADEEAALKALHPQAQAFAQEVWRGVDAGNYAAPFDRATARLRSAQTPADVQRLRSVHVALGPKLDETDAASKPGYNVAKLSRAYPTHGPKLVVESQRWSQNGVLVRTLELMRESGEFKVDAIVLGVLMYPGEENAIAENMRGPQVFR